MANFPVLFGLESLFEDNDTTSSFIRYLIEKGKHLNGYYGSPFIYSPIGDAEYWIKTEKDSNGKLEVAGAESHCSGKCGWDMVCMGMDLTPKSYSKLEKILMFRRTNGGMLPIDVINADVLPSFLDGDRVRMQVIGLPLYISYFADEDEYEEDQPTDDNGKKWSLADGTLLPVAFMANHNPDSYEQGKDYESDAFVHFRATVTKLCRGTVDINGEKINTFIRCFVETAYGPFEFEHTIDQVEEDQRKNIKVGAVVSGMCVISADVAVYEYQNGAIKDFEHDLMLLRYTFEKGDPERLRSVLTDNTTYFTDTSGKEFIGADNIIRKIKYVQENADYEYHAHFATIAAADDELEYPVGTRCIVLAAGDEDNYESIAFINVDECGMIEKIKVSTDSRYQFRIDKPDPGHSLLDDIKIPDNVAEPIILRAKFKGVFDWNFDVDLNIDDAEKALYESNAQKMLDALPDDPQSDAQTALENIFGYLFIKSIEAAYNEKYAPENTVVYSADDALSGKICSTLDQKNHSKLEAAFEIGKQFFKDVMSYMAIKDLGEEDFKETVMQALITVQHIGRMYSAGCFQEDSDKKPLNA